MDDLLDFYDFLMVLVLAVHNNKEKPNKALRECLKQLEKKKYRSGPMIPHMAYNLRKKDNPLKHLTIAVNVFCDECEDSPLSFIAFTRELSDDQLPKTPVEGILYP